MYIETSYPRLNHDAARLISPQISTADGNCLSFYFHMKGLHVRELIVQAQSLSGSRKVLWRVKGVQGDAWHFASVPLHVARHSFIQVIGKKMLLIHYRKRERERNTRCFFFILCNYVPPLNFISALNPDG